MQHSDYDDFVSIIQVVAEQYGKHLSDGVIALYWQALSGYDFPAVKDALGRHLHNPDTGQFMPKIADIVKMMGGTTADAALQAWAKVDAAVRRIGPYATVVFDDALIHRVIADMGGWAMLGVKTDDDWPFVAKEFENRYRGYKIRSEAPDYPPQLAGIFDTNNQSEGYAVAEPMLIGNAEAAKKVLHGGAKTPAIAFTKLGDVFKETGLLDHALQD